MVWAAPADALVDRRGLECVQDLQQRRLVKGHQSEAIREFARYQALLRVDLDLEPTLWLRHLIDGLHRRYAPDLLAASAPSLPHH
jgi:hypothetical protein